jgi:outer membrane receptor protein involved in Fe transport
VDAGLSVGYSAFELGLGLQNLFDSRYRAAEYNFVSDFHSGSQPTLVPARHFVAGAPRTLSLSLSVNLGGEL